MIDLFTETKRIQRLVCKNGARKYYRFRKAHFYGGVASADCIGCMLDCVFCWSQKPRKNPESSGCFYTSRQVADKLISIARHNHYSKVRVTGNEPTLCKDHLLKIINQIPTNLLFILETNGILLDENYVKSLAKFSNIHVRVSLKGGTPALFSQITDRPSEYFDLQLHSLMALLKHKVSCHPAVMLDFLNSNNLKYLQTILAAINPSLVTGLEFETMIHYPAIDSALRKKNILLYQNKYF